MPGANTVPVISLFPLPGVTWHTPEVNGGSVWQTTTVAPVVPLEPLEPLVLLVPVVLVVEPEPVVPVPVLVLVLVDVLEFVVVTLVAVEPVEEVDVEVEVDADVCAVVPELLELEWLAVVEPVLVFEAPEVEVDPLEPVE